MELIESEEDPDYLKNLNYEKVSDLKYLVATLSTKNDWSMEISIRINKTHALTKFLTSNTISRRMKVRLCAAITRPALTYGCEA